MVSCSAVRRVFLVIILCFGGAGLLSQSFAAEKTLGEIQRENDEFRQILQYLGKGTVDLYVTEAELSANKPSYPAVTMLRPCTFFGKPFFRIQRSNGDIVMIAPSSVYAIQVSAINGVRE